MQLNDIPVFINDCLRHAASHVTICVLTAALTQWQCPHDLNCMLIQCLCSTRFWAANRCRDSKHYAALTCCETRSPKSLRGSRTEAAACVLSGCTRQEQQEKQPSLTLLQLSHATSYRTEAYLRSRSITMHHSRLLQQTHAPQPLALFNALTATALP